MQQAPASNIKQQQQTAYVVVAGSDASLNLLDDQIILFGLYDSLNRVYYEYEAQHAYSRISAPNAHVRAASTSITEKNKKAGHVDGR
jgi:hypothetical protein